MKTKMPVLALILTAIMFLWLADQAGAQVSLPYTNNFYSVPNNGDAPPNPDFDFATSISENYPTNSWQVWTNDPTVEAPWNSVNWLPNDGCVQGFASIICENATTEYSTALLNVGSALAAPQGFRLSSDFKIPVFNPAREAYIGLWAFGNHPDTGNRLANGTGSGVWADLQLSTTLHSGTGASGFVNFVNAAGNNTGIQVGSLVGGKLPINTNDTYNLTVVATYDFNTNIDITFVATDVSQGLSNSISEIISFAAGNNNFLSTAALPGNGSYFGYCDREDANGNFTTGPQQTNITVQANFSLTPVLNPPSGPPSPVSLAILPRTNLYVGANATLSSSFSGVTPMEVKWQYGGASLSFTNDFSAFSTNASLTVSNVSLANAGYYRAYATNSLGTNSTAWILLTVFPIPANPLIDVQASDANNGGYFQQGAAVLGNGADAWNIVNVWTNTTVTSNIALYDTTGAAAGVTLSYTPGTAAYINSSAVIPLFTQFLQGSTTVTLSGLQATAPYDVVVYAIGNANQGGVVSGAVTGTSTGGAALVSDVGGFTNGVNYVQNQFALSDGSGNLAFTVVGSWNGLQITKSVALPTVALQAVTGGQLQVTWSGGQSMLLQTTNLLGPWTTNNSTPPYTFTPSGAQMFFRAQ
jgi:hypothetical protein